MNKAIAEFDQAATLDPNFALAYAGLADSYALIEQYLGMHTSSEPMPNLKT